MELYAYLGTAHIDIVGIFCQRSCAQVVFVQTLAATFYNSYISGRENTLDTDTAFCLEVITDNELLCLGNAYGAMCQYDFVGAGIDHGRIRHESRFPGQHFYNKHAEYGL